jgi:hypothetical protein
VSFGYRGPALGLLKKVDDGRHIAPGMKSIESKAPGSLDSGHSRLIASPVKSARVPGTAPIPLRRHGQAWFSRCSGPFTEEEEVATHATWKVWPRSRGPFLT